MHIRLSKYPTKIRATGAGVAASVGRLGGIFGPLMVGYLVAANAPLTLIFTLFSMTILVAVVAVAALGKETKQQALID